MPLLPVAFYGLEVPCGDVIVPASEFPATYRITMAALDPSEPVELDEKIHPRATLKIIRQSPEDEDDEEPNDFLSSLLAGSDSEEDSEEEEEEANGGPSDPLKSKKARKEAAIKQLMASLTGDDSDEEMAESTNGKKAKSGKGKGKAKATEKDEDESEEESDGEEDLEVEEFVLCTLDPVTNYQQTLDITVGEGERVFFKVSGSHSVFLTGNYLVPDDDGHNHHREVYDSDEDDEDDEDYDLSPDEDELELEMDGDESDDLDGLEDPRITEVDTDEEEAPKLVKVEKKGKNKRSADDIEEGASLDDIIAKSIKPTADAEPKLSKKQQKKLKKNNGEAAPAKTEESSKESASAKSDKKVQFAKELEQGPTGSKAKAVAAPAKDNKGKATLGVKVVNGIKIDDKKLGTGPAAKKGDKVGMRYIGKLADGKVFDANKSGKPFAFKLGVGDVIKGWDIGVAGMSVGGERRLVIPAALAYGSKSLPGIPANSNLTFDVKLLEIK